jgi:hypothetical protein
MITCNRNQKWLRDSQHAPNVADVVIYTIFKLMITCNRNQKWLRAFGSCGMDSMIAIILLIIALTAATASTPIKSLGEYSRECQKLYWHLDWLESISQSINPANRMLSSQPIFESLGSIVMESPTTTILYAIQSIIIAGFLGKLYTSVEFRASPRAKMIFKVLIFLCLAQFLYACFVFPGNMESPMTRVSIYFQEKVAADHNSLLSEYYSADEENPEKSQSGLDYDALGEDGDLKNLQTREEIVALKTNHILKDLNGEKENNTPGFRAGGIDWFGETKRALLLWNIMLFFWCVRIRSTTSRHYSWEGRSRRRGGESCGGRRASSIIQCALEKGFRC